MLIFLKSIRKLLKMWVVEYFSKKDGCYYCLFFDSYKNAFQFFLRFDSTKNICKKPYFDSNLSGLKASDDLIYPAASRSIFFEKLGCFFNRCFFSCWFYWFLLVVLIFVVVFPDKVLIFLGGLGG